MTRLLRWVLGITSVLTAGGVLYFSVDSANSINDLEGQLAEIVANLEPDSLIDYIELDEMSDSGDPYSLSGSDLVMDNDSSSFDLEEFDVTIDEDKDEKGIVDETEGDINLVLPDSGNKLVLLPSSKRISFEVKHIANDSQKCLDIGMVIIAQNTGNSLVPLSPAIEGKAEKVCFSSEIKLKTIEILFEEVPPSGTYTAWILIESKDNKTLSQEVSLDVASYPQDAIQLREDATGGKVEDITISGVSKYPSWFGVKDDIVWDKYLLRIWHETEDNPNFVLVPSELASFSSGRSGLLKAIQQVSDEDRSIGYQIYPENVEFPGEYQGSVSIYPNDRSSKESVRVTAKLRDNLFWPFLIIGFTAYLIGQLLRFGVKDTSKNVVFTKLLIEAARENLVEIGVCESVERNPACRDISIDLGIAESALSFDDFTKADEYLKRANQNIQRLKQARFELDSASEIINTYKNFYGSKPEIRAEMVKITLVHAERHLMDAEACYILGNLSEMKTYLDMIPVDLENAKKNLEAILPKAEVDAAALEEVEIPEKVQVLKYRIEVKTAGAPFYGNQLITFGLVSDSSQIAQPFFVTWKVLEKKRNKYAVLEQHTSPLANSEEYRFRPLDKKAKYKVSVEVTNSIDLPIIITPGFKKINVVPTPFTVAKKRVSRTAIYSSIAWALVASVSGIIYISSMLPTFGKPLDYFYAIAWALGLSTTAIPAEELAGKIFKRIQTGSPPSRPPTTPATLTTPTSAKVKVPRLVEITLEVAKQKAGESQLKIEPEPDDTNKDKKVSHQDPEEGKEVDPNTVIKLTLEDEKPLTAEKITPDIKTPLNKILQDNPSFEIMVDSQDPKAGEGLGAENKIILTMNKTFADISHDMFQIIVNTVELPDGWKIQGSSVDTESENKLNIVLTQS